MDDANVKSRSELPSKRVLLKSTAIAVIGIVALIIMVVLPAEYAVDVTGVGQVLGLTKMGEIKVSLATEAASESMVQHNPSSSDAASSADGAQPPSSPQVAPAVVGRLQATVRYDTVTISLNPDEGKEVKLVMNEGDQVEYYWWSDGGRVNFDAHADSEELKIKYHNYTKGSEQQSEGILEAAFTGKHGWFWRNRTSSSVSVTLQVSGIYSDIGS